MDKTGKRRSWEQRELRQLGLPLRGLAYDALWDVVVSGFAFVEEELEAERAAGSYLRPLTGQVHRQLVRITWAQPHEKVWARPMTTLAGGVRLLRSWSRKIWQRLRRPDTAAGLLGKASKSCAADPGRRAAISSLLVCRFRSRADLELEVVARLRP